MDAPKELYLAALEFNKRATSLFGNLCSISGTTIHDIDRIYRIKEKFGQQRSGNLNNNWKFCFHGSECRFTEIKTNYDIEIIVINGANLGVIDFYFFKNFIHQYTHYTSLLNRYSKRLDLLELELCELYYYGFLSRIESCNNATSYNRSLYAKISEQTTL